MKFMKIIVLLVGISVCLSKQVIAQCGSVNIALNKTTSANGSASGTNPAGTVNGVVDASGWVPLNNTTSWMYVDLGSSKTVCKVIVKWGRWNAATNFKIQMTNTPGTEASWADIANVPNNNPTVGNESGDYYTQFVYNELNITGTSNTGRYVRLLMENVPSGANYYVHELEVFEATASNSAPSCALTNPNTNITLPVNTTITLTANATDPDGSIAEVAFYEGSNLLGIAPQTTTGPYTHQWTPTATGTYVIQAKAKDNIGAIGNSLTVTVTVTPPASGWSLGGNATTGLTDPYIGTSDQKPLIVKTWNSERLRILDDGKVLIGTTGLPSGVPANTLLGVEGFIVSKGLRVTQSNWPDYVFDGKYKLMPLADLDSYIRRYKHLPGVPSAKQVDKEGINVGENQATLLKKIEELTLYLLQQNEKIKALQLEIESLKAKK